MKRIVNGEQVELKTGEAVVQGHGDRFLVRTGEGVFSALSARRGEDVLVSYRGQTYLVEMPTRTRAHRTLASGDLRAPMPGVVVGVLVEVGQHVETGQKIVVIEAMKTQQSLTTPFDGVVAKLPVEVGQQVGEGDLLAALEPEATS